eukprot:2127683-Pyramimonas_sp.AAC.1
MLKQSGQLLPCAKMVGRLITDDPSMEEWIADQFKQRRIPRGNTLVVHRLSVHLSWCMHMREVHDALLSSPGGVCVWRTVDSSPQH